jgi:CheY-like chemotaxis protein
MIYTHAGHSGIIDGHFHAPASTLTEGHMKEKKRGSPRILVVDNNQDLLSTIQEYLEHHGYRVMSAATGLEAVRLLRAQTFDFLITDIVMPDISGLGLIEISKKEFPELPIIAMTGYSEQVKDLTLERSPDYYIEKPFELSRLLEIMESLIGKG